MIKVSIIGAGMIGGTIAHILAQKGLYDLCLIDISKKAEGKALDIMQSLCVKGESIAYAIKGSDQIQDIKHSDVVIVTAGHPRQLDKKRSDLLFQNGNIIEEVANHVKEYAPDAFVIVITNPVDSMTWHFQKTSKLPENKVVGLSGVLDTGRFRYYLSQLLNIDVRDINTFVVGSHDDQMLPLLSYTTINGIPVLEYIEKSDIKIDDLHLAIHHTKKSGEKILTLMEHSSYVAPAQACVQILEAYVFDQKRILSCSLNLNMVEPENDVYIGLPCIIGGNGVEDVYPIKLNAQEEINFRQSVESLLKQNIELSFAGKKAAG